MKKVAIFTGLFGLLSPGLVQKGGMSSLSKTTKLILLDSLLQEVCISSGLGLVAHLEFARVECLS